MADPERPTLTQYDDRIHYRCPQLGDTIPFSYCRKMNSGLPCRTLFTCWIDQLNLTDFLQENFTPEEIDKVFFQPSPGRIGTLFDVLNRVVEEKKQPE